jgi:hypothetical protein
MIKNNDLCKYIYFLDLIRSARLQADALDLDPFEEVLLNSFFLSWQAGNQVTVTKAIVICSGFSATTVRRRLKSMCKKRIITLVRNETDLRVVYVMPTDEVNLHFARLGQCVHSAANWVG